MTAQLRLLQAGVQRGRDLVGLGQSLGSMTHGVVDGSDIYRAALTQSVSALDQYLHAVILDRAARIVLGELPTGSTSRFGLGIHSIREIQAASPVQVGSVLNAHLAGALGKMTFQMPDEIASGLAMVGVAKPWSAAFGAAAGTTMQALSLVVFRRNRIVHQCDADPLTPGTPTPMEASDALQALMTVELVGRGLDSLC